MTVSPDDIRTRFSTALSDMYRAEVPLYGDLLRIVATINEHFENAPSRIAIERHGAIRLGLPAELALIRRLFATMGMHPVGYYDLAPAGIPVHSTAFRPIADAALAHNPFRVFTSLLRLDLIADPDLRREAQDILQARSDRLNPSGRPDRNGRSRRPDRYRGRRPRRRGAEHLPLARRRDRRPRHLRPPEAPPIR